MGVSKVILNDETLMDVTDTTVDEDNLLSGETALGADGETVRGSVVVPTKTSDLTNDSGFISAETDPTVPSWAKQSSKPTYTATEVGAQPTITANGLLKGNGSGTISAAVSGTDYQAPLPSQTGNNGKFLTTNGSALSWGSVDALPSQTGQSGKFLTTNGTTASWAEANGTFIVHLTINTVSLPYVIQSADKTYADIYAAAVSGKSVVAIDSDNVVYPMYQYDQYLISFELVDTYMATYITVDTNDSWTCNNFPVSNWFIADYDVTTYSELSQRYGEGYGLAVRYGAALYVLDSCPSGDWSFYFTNVNGPRINTVVCTPQSVWSVGSVDMQEKITASGLLKGNGSGGVTAATAGTDYQAPLPSQSGQNGKFLTTNGSALSWGSVTVPTKTSDLTNDSGFITGYTETDPTVPSWAKQPSKPSYTATEVGALPNTTTIPAYTSQLINDSGFITASGISCKSVPFRDKKIVYLNGINSSTYANNGWALIIWTSGQGAAYTQAGGVVMWNAATPAYCNFGSSSFNYVGYASNYSRVQITLNASYNCHGIVITSGGTDVTFA